jgi:hypothetical protein
MSAVARVTLAPLRALERFVFAAEDPRRLAAVRIGLCGLLAIRLAVGDYTFVAGQPGALYDPVSFMKLLPEMPSEGVTVAAQAIGVVAALAAAAGVATRATLPLAVACALLLNGMLNATGKIIHNDVLLVLCLLPLLAAPRAASARWTLREAVRTRTSGRDPGVSAPAPGEAFGWPVRTAMLLIALAYFFVGFQKLRFSGIEWVTSENLRWVLYASSDSQADPNGLALFVADRAWLAHLLAAGTIVIEVGFPLALFVPRLRWLFVPAAVSLHLGIYLAMGLDYSAQALTVIIVFVNWPLVIDALRARMRGHVIRRTRPHEAPG